jgi:hypothetical protein
MNKIILFWLWFDSKSDTTKLLLAIIMFLILFWLLPTGLNYIFDCYFKNVQ